VIGLASEWELWCCAGVEAVVEPCTMIKVSWLGVRCMVQKRKECQNTTGMVLSLLKDDLEVKVGQLQHFLQVWFRSGVGRTVFHGTLREEDWLISHWQTVKLAVAEYGFNNEHCIKLQHTSIVLHQIQTHGSYHQGFYQHYIPSQQNEQGWSPCTDQVTVTSHSLSEKERMPTHKDALF